MKERYLHSLEAIPLDEIVREEYRIYQLYTLMDRAIPYLKDGLKPVQRRILYTLWKNHNKGLMKVSSATGLVLTLHPHGPNSIESCIVNMGQDFTFSNNYPLIDKKGYFGERMETSSAAARYIECKQGKVAEILLFDDMNQVEMVPNYDEKVMEPLALHPKLPVMIINGAEGIGTGFSSVIPSFNHKDVVDSMISFVETGKARRIKPWVRNYTEKIEVDQKNRVLFKMHFKEMGDKIFISEAPRGYDANRIYKHLNKFIEKGFLKDFVDSSADNTINVELIFKRGQRPTLSEVEETMAVTSSQSPNYTLIADEGVVVFDKVEEIIEQFTANRIKIVTRRYELLAIDCQRRLTQNSEIVRFIKQKHYAKAEKSANRKAFVDYLKEAKFTYADYLADMAIYRMTKDEVKKRKILIDEDKKKLKEYLKISKSKTLIKKKLIMELLEVKEQLTTLFKSREKEREKMYKDAGKKSKKRRKR